MKTTKKMKLTALLLLLGLGIAGAQTATNTAPADIKSDGTTAHSVKMSRTPVSNVIIPVSLVNAGNVPEGLVISSGRPAVLMDREAFPLGNGRIGAMFTGGIERDVIPLNEGSFWAYGAVKNGHTPTINTAEGRTNLPEVCRLLRECRFVEAKEYWYTNFWDPKKFKPQARASYQPFGNLWFDWEYGQSESGSAVVNDYVRTLNLATAVGTMDCTVGRTFTYGKHYGVSRRYFVSYPDQVMVMRFEGEIPLTFTAHLESASIGGEALTTAEGTELKFAGARKENGLRFSARVRILNEGGNVTVVGNALRVIEAKAVTVIVSLATDYKPEYPTYRSGVDPVAVTAARISAAAQKSYVELERRHVEDYQNLFKRVEIDLGGEGGKRLMPDKAMAATTDLGGEGGKRLMTDEALSAYKRNPDNRNLEEIIFQYGRYLLISSSREGGLPPNLQGLWNMHSSPPWLCNYTLDANLNQCYMPAFTANLKECFGPYLLWLKSLEEPSRIDARERWGAKGWYLSMTSDPFGTIFLSENAIINTGWVLMPIYDYFRFTGDKNYLRTNAYPLMKGAAEYYLSRLVPHSKTGEPVLVPTSSPEKPFIYEGNRIWLCEGSAYDQQAIHDLFSSCIEASRILGVDADFRSQLETVRAKLRPVQIGKNGEVQEWIEDFKPADLKNRHISHLLGLYQGNLIDPVTTPAWADAARKTIENRGIDNQLRAGWPGAFRMISRARLNEGDKALWYLQRAFNETISPNLLEREPYFQISASMAYTAAIAEMLLQSHIKDEVRLLPALPSAWPDGYVKGLCARGGIEADIYWKAGALSRAVLRSERGGPVAVRYGAQTLLIQTEPGKKYGIGKVAGALQQVALDSPQDGNVIFTAGGFERPEYADGTVAAKNVGNSRTWVVWDGISKSNNAKPDCAVVQSFKVKAGLQALAIADVNKRVRASITNLNISNPVSYWDACYKSDAANKFGIASIVFVMDGGTKTFSYGERLGEEVWYDTNDPEKKTVAFFGDWARLTVRFDLAADTYTLYKDGVEAFSGTLGFDASKILSWEIDVDPSDPRRWPKGQYCFYVDDLQVTEKLPFP